MPFLAHSALGRLSSPTRSTQQMCQGCMLLVGDDEQDEVDAELVDLALTNLLSWAKYSPNRLPTPSAGAASCRL